VSRLTKPEVKQDRKENRYVAYALLAMPLLTVVGLIAFLAWVN